MDNQQTWLVDLLHSLIVQYPTRSTDPDWLAAEASETYGADPKEIRAAYDAHHNKLTGGHHGE